MQTCALYRPHYKTMFKEHGKLHVYLTFRRLVQDDGGTRLGDPVSATTFIIYLERIISVIRDRDTEVRIQGYI